MSISSTINRNNYIGNDSTNVYSYSFKVFTKNDFEIKVRDSSSGLETLLTVDVDYTVSGAGTVSGGNITLIGSGDWLVSSKLTAGYELSIRRLREIKQLADIKNQGSFFPEVHEDVFDKLIMIDLQQQDSIDRSLKFPSSVNPTSFNNDMPASIVGQGGATLMTNPTGDGWLPGPTADQITAAQGYSLDALSSATAAAVSAAEAAASAASVVAPQITGTRSVPIGISASVGISFTGLPVFHTWFVEGSGGPVTVTANPAITAGSQVGQKLTIIGRSDINTLTFNDGNGLDLNGPVILESSSCIGLEFDGTNWFEIFRR